MKFSTDVDLASVAELLPRNFTGADFSALTSEAYMIAVKRKIEEVQNEIESFKQEKGLAQEDELLPETYYRMRFPDPI